MPTPASPEPGFFARLFLSPSERRLRAFWRLAIQTFLMLGLMFCVGVALMAPYLILTGFEPADLPFLALSEVVELAAITVSIVLVRRFVDRRSFASLGFRLDRRAASDLAAGLGIAFTLMGLIYLLMSALGWVRFEGFAWQTQPLPAVLGGGLGMLLLFVLTGWNEELLSRGYHLQTIASGTNLTWGVLLSSLLFGLLHLTNPGATWIAVLGVALAGLMLAYAYVRTGQLWLSIGLHIGWNFCEGPLFGFAVSGLDFFHLVHIAVHGPDAWTGGVFGPEAGLIVLPALAIGIALIFVYSRFVQPRGSPPGSSRP